MGVDSDRTEAPCQDFNSSSLNIPVPPLHNSGTEGASRLLFQDLAALATVLALLSAPFVSGLGFYSDDWSFLRTFLLSGDQSLSGLVHSLFEADANTRARPLQVLYLAAIYKTFGLQPIAYHLLNSFVLFIAVCALYITLNALFGNRLFSLAVALLFSTLPHYSTDRFWFAAFQANLSMALCFTALYSSHRQLNSAGARRALWLAAAALSMAASILAYEVFIPLYLLASGSFALKHFITQRNLRTPSARLPFDLATLLVFPLPLVALAVLFKRSVSDRSGPIDWSLLEDALPASYELALGVYGANLPQVLETIFRAYFQWPHLASASATAILVGYYLLHVARGCTQKLPSLPALAISSVGSFVATGLSYAYFFRWAPVSTGIDNRLTIAAAVCVSIFITSFFACFFRQTKRPSLGVKFFCASIALACGCGVLITNTIARFWVDASQAQAKIMRDVRAVWISPAKGSSLLLHGFCSWNGPGIVFEKDWDVTGVLGVIYRDRTLRGDVLRPWMVASGDGLQSRSALYPYTSLYLFHVRTRQLHQVTDQNSASEALRSLEADDASDCAGNYRGGAGLPIW